MIGLLRQLQMIGAVPGKRLAAVRISGNIRRHDDLRTVGPVAVARLHDADRIVHDAHGAVGIIEIKRLCKAGRNPVRRFEIGRLRLGMSGHAAGQQGGQQHCCRCGCGIFFHIRSSFFCTGSGNQCVMSASAIFSSSSAVPLFVCICTTYLPSNQISLVAFGPYSI